MNKDLAPWPSLSEVGISTSTHESTRRGVEGLGHERAEENESDDDEHEHEHEHEEDSDHPSGDEKGPIQTSDAEEEEGMMNDDEPERKRRRRRRARRTHHEPRDVKETSHNCAQDCRDDCGYRLVVIIRRRPHLAQKLGTFLLKLIEKNQREEERLQR